MKFDQKNDRVIDRMFEAKIIYPCTLMQFSDKFVNNYIPFCTQVLKGLTHLTGWGTPVDISEADLERGTTGRR